MSTAAIRNSTALTPAQVEKAKTPQQKAWDWIYSLNHSATCLLITDMFGLSMAANAYNSIAKNKWHVEEDDHGYSALSWVWDNLTKKHKDPAHVAKIAGEEESRIADALAEEATFCAPKLTPTSSGKEAFSKFGKTSSRWLISEAIGDLGAVPFTIFLQRKCPAFMDQIRKGIEWSMGGVFRRTTTRSAENWGQKHGFAKDSEEVHGRQKELYDYEISHMPQMAVWTVSSVLLNYAAMEGLHAMKPTNFEKPNLKEFAAVKGAGAAMTAGLVLSIRGLTPGGAHWWDRTMGKHVIMPVTKVLGSLVGIGSADVDAFQKSRDTFEAG